MERGCAGRDIRNSRKRDHSAADTVIYGIAPGTGLWPMILSCKRSCPSIAWT